jgi:hypothetical protein
VRSASGRTESWHCRFGNPRKSQAFRRLVLRVLAGRGPTNAQDPITHPLQSAGNSTLQQY